MKKRIILAFISLMMVLSCANAQAEANGQFYLEPFIGGTVSPNHGINLGLSAGYAFYYGLGLEVTAAYRDLSGYNIFQFGAMVKYECPYLYLGYPIIGAGAGFIVDMPQYASSGATVDPTANYKLGYAFRVVEDYFDIGVEYRGDAIFMLDHSTRRLWGTTVEHSIVATFRVYLTH